MKKIVTNFVLLVGTYIVPLYVFRQNQDNYPDIEIIQKTVFLVLFFGAILLTYLNHKNRKSLNIYYQSALSGMVSLKNLK